MSALIPKRKKKGQSSLEYLLLMAAVISFLVIFLKKGGQFNRTLDETWSDQANRMVNATTNLLEKTGL